MRHTGHIRVKCPCGNIGRFSASEMRDHRRRLRLHDEWRAVARCFRCSRCGNRILQVGFVEGEPTHIPHNHPWTRGIPAGIDPYQWRSADDRQRKWLLRRARG